MAKRSTVKPSFIVTDNEKKVEDYGNLVGMELINTNLPEDIDIDSEEFKSILEAIEKKDKNIVTKATSFEFEDTPINSESLLESIEIKLKTGWFECFAELYNEKVNQYFKKYIDIVPISSEVSSFRKLEDEDDRIVLYSQFFNQMYFNLWKMVLYNPEIVPSNDKDITSEDLQMMSDLIDEQMVAIKSFRLLTMIYEDDYAEYKDHETIERNLILLSKMDKKKKEINPESKSMLNSYIFEVVLNKYKSKNIASNLEQFLTEFLNVLPEYKEKLEQEKRVIKERKLFNKKGELLRVENPKDSKIFNRDGETWKNLSKGLDQFRNSYRRKQLKRKKK